MFADRDLFGFGVVLICQTQHDGDVRFEVWGRDDAEFDLRRSTMVPVPDDWFDPRGGHKDPLTAEDLREEMDVRFGRGGVFVTDHVAHPSGEVWVGTYRDGVLVHDPEH